MTLSIPDAHHLAHFLGHYPAHYSPHNPVHYPAYNPSLYAAHYPAGPADHTAQEHMLMGKLQLVERYSSTVSGRGMSHLEINPIRS